MKVVNFRTRPETRFIDSVYLKESQFFKMAGSRSFKNEGVAPLAILQK